MGDEKVSFLPEDYVARRVEMRTNVICLSLFGVVLIAVVGAYLVTSGQRSSVIKKQQEINAAFSDAAKRIQEHDELQRQKKQLQRKARVTATLIERVPRSNLLAELTNRRPEGVTFQELDLKSKKIATASSLTGKNAGSALNAATAKGKADPKKKNEPPLEVPRYDVTLTLIGVAPTDIQVAQYMAALARCQMLDDINLVYSEESRSNDLAMRKFRIDMRINPDADVRMIDPLIVDRNAGHFADASILEPSSPDKD